MVFKVGEKTISFNEAHKSNLIIKISRLTILLNIGCYFQYLEFYKRNDFAKN